MSVLCAFFLLLISAGVCCYSVKWALVRGGVRMDWKNSLIQNTNYPSNKCIKIKYKIQFSGFSVFSQFGIAEHSGLGYIMYTKLW